MIVIVELSVMYFFVGVDYFEEFDGCVLLCC